jgi:hypothetical protein
MEQRADVQCRVPTAADSRQVDMPRGANRRRRRIKCTSPGTLSSRQKLDGPLQFRRLPQYVFQKIGHEQQGFRFRISSEPRRNRIKSAFVLPAMACLDRSHRRADPLLPGLPSSLAIRIAPTESPGNRSFDRITVRRRLACTRSGFIWHVWSLPEHIINCLEIFLVPFALT